MRSVRLCHRVRTNGTSRSAINYVSVRNKETKWLLPPIDDCKGLFVVLIGLQVHGGSTVSLYADD